ncbi:4-hydroxy-3-methylbut-2-enyl diphosphate reductase [Sphingomonas sp. PB4P5]|uniref:4-hydroxy-3-methylbut-2-enyl diphosphate reductase n=1 Tax=Parasphingomonas puruogangriensis TaxID=3096155 RepID=UPI002FCAAAB8
MATAPKPALNLLIAAPRGFCAGVDRAIRIVELAIEKHGSPVYVRHEIVHNKYVVDSLKDKGAVFVEDLSQVPQDVPVVFSAHGVPKSVPLAAQDRGLTYLDATCPLVSKVHRQAERLVAQGKHIVFIGHAGHPEVIGTFGQVPPGAMTLIETVADAEAFMPADPTNIAFLTQTTLSVDDTAEVVATLQRRFNAIQAPRPDDICYATSNRQTAVKAIAAMCDAMLVIGAPNSSNSVRLVEVAEREGTPARLIQRAQDLDLAFLAGVGTLGITAGASAPEILVRELVARLGEHYTITEREVETNRETISFKLPRGLEAEAA